MEKVAYELIMGILRDPGERRLRLLLVPFALPESSRCLRRRGRFAVEGGALIWCPEADIVSYRVINLITDVPVAAQPKCSRCGTFDPYGMEVSNLGTWQCQDHW